MYYFSFGRSTAVLVAAVLLTVGGASLQPISPAVAGPIACCTKG
jgi:hypothetical protein